jgi:hypothetical protein
MVTGKSGEDTLVSSDGGTCRVTAKAFERVRIGDEHVCVWESTKGSDRKSFGDPQRGGLQGPVVRPKIPPAER